MTNSEPTLPRSSRKDRYDLHILDIIYLSVLIISFPGYPLLAAISTISGMDSTSFSVVMRSINVLLSLILIMYGITYFKRRNSYILWMILFFWACYLFRIFYDTVYTATFLSQDISYYWMWAVGASLLPMLGLALRYQNPEKAGTYFGWVYYVTILAAAITAYAASGSMIEEGGIEVATGRLRIGNTLNPISLGHLGATLTVLSVYALVFPSRRWKGISRKALLVAGLSIGFYLLIAANSRGPVVATFACMTIIIASVQFRYKFALLGVFLILVAGMFPAARYLEETQGISTLSRVLGTSVREQAESSSRLDLYGSALDVFRKNPITGGAMEDPITGSYPHNVLIESLMAVGLLPSIILLLSLSLVSIRALILFRKHTKFGWPSLLFFQYLVAAQFSGSLYNVNHMWSAIGFLLSLELSNVIDRRSMINDRNTKTSHLTKKSAGLP